MPSEFWGKVSGDGLVFDFRPMLVHQNLAALNLLEDRVTRTISVNKMCAPIPGKEMHRVVYRPVVRQEDIPRKSFSGFVLAHGFNPLLPWYQAPLTPGGWKVEDKELLFGGGGVGVWIGGFW